MSPDFIHLRLHSEFSIADSVVRIPRLIEAVAEQGMPAVAITDQSNLFGVVKFYKTALKAGIKPIIGADLFIDAPHSALGYAPLPVLCSTAAGYLNLKQLMTRSFVEGQRNGVPVVAEEWLSPKSTAGLIALSGGQGGALGQLLLEKKFGRADIFLDKYRGLFNDDFYLEIHRTNRSNDNVYLERAVNLSCNAGCALVATNDVRFLRQDEFEVHEARTCVQGGYTLDDRRRPRLYSDHQYLRTADEMRVLFADLPEALDNTVSIAQRCNVEIRLGESVLPDYEVPEGETAATFLHNIAAEGLDKKLSGRELDSEQRDTYVKRLERELGVIEGMGFPGYFLIVADFICWAKANGVPVGPGRGSGAGSLVAWVIGITNVDPLAFDLLFERFLNPERVSMPDFDVDFCMEGRDRVIEYVADHYGHDRVSQIITYGTMGAKAVIRDVGRVMGQPYGFADRIARLVPPTPGMTLEKAFIEEPELEQLYQSEDDVRTLIDMARQLEGLARNAGTHAGGVVIAPSALTDFAPLYTPDGETGTVTQFDMKDVEDVGLVKFDFLGLRTLTVIERALQTINAHKRAANESPIDIETIPMDDAATFRLLVASQTHAVFQLESPGMRDLIKRLKPDCFEDIVALVALFRPGPLQSGMVDTFIERKHGGADVQIDYMHPKLEPVLSETYGIILYQEQVMQAAQILAGYSLGQADLLRRAMGKKKAEEMEKQRTVFVDGAIAGGVDADLASHIFGLMEKFAEYGFNKSHSVAYALLAYQTAYLKAHYPEALMAAVLTADMEYTDKLKLHHRETRAMELELLRPDVNESETVFAVAGEGQIRYGLGALKGLGRAAADSIVAERQANGPFRELGEFCRRVDSQKVNKRSLESLVKSGALDSLGENRPSLLADLPAAVSSAEQHARALAAGQNDMFGVEAPPPPPRQESRLPRWSPLKLYRSEYESLGLYLSGHPYDQYRKESSFIGSGPIGNVLRGLKKPDKGEDSWRSTKEVTLAGLITDIRKRGNRVSMFLDDGLDRVELSLFAEGFQTFKALLEEHSIRVVSGKIRFDDFIDGWRLAVKDVRDIDRVIEQRATRLTIHWQVSEMGDLNAAALREMLEPFTPGRCEVAVVYTKADAQARFEFGRDWCVRPSGELRDRLAEAVGVRAFRFEYHEQSNAA